MISDTNIIKDDNAVHCLKVMQLVCDQQPGCALQEVTDALIKQMAPHRGIHCRKWVIQYVYTSLLINSPMSKDV